MGDKKDPRFKSNSLRFKEAFGFAADLHADQTRKSTDVPYIAHLMGVSSNAVEYGGGEDEAIAALLHDAPEDCGGRPVLEDIRARFGDRVANIVEACTDTFEEPKPEWIERKVRYVAHVKQSTPQARLVSAADKLYNVTAILKDYRAIGEKVFERFKKTKWHVLWYYRSLAREFLSAEDNQLNREFARTVAELENLVESDSTPEGLEERDRVYKELDNEVVKSQ